MKVKNIILTLFIFLCYFSFNNLSFAQKDEANLIENNEIIESSVYTQDLSIEDMSGGFIFTKDENLTEDENNFIKNIFNRNHSEVRKILNLDNNSNLQVNTINNKEALNPNIIYSIYEDNNTTTDNKMVIDNKTITDNIITIDDESIKDNSSLNKNKIYSNKKTLILTPLHIALINKDLEMLSILLESKKINLDIPSCIHINSHKENIIKLNDNNTFDNSTFNSNTSDNMTNIKKSNMEKCSEISPLSFAILNNNLQAAKLLLDNGANPNFTPVGGNPPIYYVKSDDAIKLLKEYNANINKKSEIGESPLFDAVKNKDTKLIEELVKNGANVNVKNKNEETLLYFAIKNSDFNIARFLIDNKANINLTSTKEKISPLMATMSNSKHDTGFLRYIIFKGANINYKDANGRNCFYYHYIPTDNDDFDRLKESLEILLEYDGNINNQDNKGNTILHKFYKYYYKIYKDFKPNINIQNNNGDTPLHVATRDGNIVSILTGAPNKNIKNNQGLTPIMIAEKQGNKTNIDYLKLNNIEYLLIAGAISRNAEMVKNSIDKGINLNSKINGHMPLYYALKGGDSEIYLQMINGGAKLSLLPSFIDVALNSFSNNRNEIIRVNLLKTLIDSEISKNWNKYSDFILKLVKTQCEKNIGQGYIKEILSYAIEKGGNPYYKNSNGESPIIVASKSIYPSFDIIHILISVGVNVDDKTIDNTTPIYECAKVPYNKNNEFEALIKNSKIDINTKYGSDNETLLMAAAENGNRLITSMLIAKGADDTIKNNDNLTALDLSKNAFSKLIESGIDPNSQEYENYDFIVNRFLSDKNSLSECRSGITAECKKYYQAVHVNKTFNKVKDSITDNTTSIDKDIQIEETFISNPINSSSIDNRTINENNKSTENKN